MTAEQRANKKRLAKESNERIAKAQAETQAVVDKGFCPICGAKVKRNLSLHGWFQCEQLGAVGFRKDAEKESCSWQGFTA